MLRALEDVRATGKARAVAVASDEAGGLAAIAHRRPLRGGAGGGAGAGRGRRAPARGGGGGLRRLLHSVFGVEGSLAALKARAAADPAFRAAVTGRGGDVDQALARRLLERALARNPDGVVLVSMFSEASRARNLAVAAAPLPEDAGLLDRLTPQVAEG